MWVRVPSAYHAVYGTQYAGRSKSLSTSAVQSTGHCILCLIRFFALSLLSAFSIFRRFVFVLYLALACIGECHVHM